MAPDFIFMLTRADRTIEDAQARLPEVIAAGIRHIGFKDVGLPMPELQDLAAEIKAAGATLYLEVVSLDAASEAASAKAAVELGVDVLMGGTRPNIVVPLLAGTRIRYYPFPGKIIGHPSQLEGTIESIVASAARLLAVEGVHGLDLLAYRFAGNVEELMRRVCEAAGAKPVIVAGSIDRAERLRAATRSGAAGFTIGTAALDGMFPAAPGLTPQLAFIMATLEKSLEEETIWRR
jgi:4-hydroxythreonine-4-phosphate dehydrogenase